jgi:hypothetical protein
MRDEYNDEHATEHDSGMVESPEHIHLKNVALLWLIQQGCFMVDKEVALSQIGLMRYTEFDNKTIIDALGVAMRFSSKMQGSDDVEGFDASALRDMEAGECILKGVEVKVSRGDFRAGFACSGCNYHYVLTPLRLLAPSEVPDGVGLIEYNKHKFRCKAEEGNPVKPFTLEGLRVVKKAMFRRVPRFQVDGAISNIAERNLRMNWRRYGEAVSTT